VTPTRLPLYWRVFAVNASLLTVIAILLIVSPVTISFPIAMTEAVVVVIGLVVTIAANAVLLQRAAAAYAEPGDPAGEVAVLAGTPSGPGRPLAAHA
jgi:hypothetical protein